MTVSVITVRTIAGANQYKRNPLYFCISKYCDTKLPRLAFHIHVFGQNVLMKFGLLGA